MRSRHSSTQGDAPRLRVLCGSPPRRPERAIGAEAQLRGQPQPRQLQPLRQLQRALGQAAAAAPPQRHRQQCDLVLPFYGHSYGAPAEQSSLPFGSKK